MPHNDPVLCAELNKLTESIASSNRKIDRAITNQSVIDKQLKEVLSAFPDGAENHREYHEAIIKAKKAEEDFWIDMKKEIIKKGLIGFLVILLGLTWLGVQAWLRINLIK